MTKELATEIKSEIREVISQVEDVLDSTAEALDNSMITVNSLSNITRYSFSYYINILQYKI